MRCTGGRVREVNAALTRHLDLDLDLVVLGWGWAGPAVSAWAGNLCRAERIEARMASVWSVWRWAVRVGGIPLGMNVTMATVVVVEGILAACGSTWMDDLGRQRRSTWLVQAEDGC